MKLDVSLLFSYWIYLFSIAFIFGLSKYPPYILIFSGTVFKLLYNLSLPVGIYISIIAVSSIILYYVFRKQPLNLTSYNFIPELLVTLIYLLYLHTRKTNIIQVYKTQVSGLLHFNSDRFKIFGS